MREAVLERRLTPRTERHSIRVDVRIRHLRCARRCVNKSNGEHATDTRSGKTMNETTLVQRAYSAVLAHFIKTGRAPHYTELGATLGLRPDEARQAQHEAAESSVACWFVKDTDYVESWAPFSNVPTHYLVTIRGDQKWYGQ